MNECPAPLPWSNVAGLVVVCGMFVAFFVLVVWRALPMPPPYRPLSEVPVWKYTRTKTRPVPKELQTRRRKK